MKWSMYFQNPEFLERTRMFLLPKDMYPLVRKWCGVKEGMRILDVGCGTGFFTRLMADGVEKVSIVGLDIEEPFLVYAKNVASEQHLPIEFVLGDALDLPFADDSFDLVTSHTFFTSIHDPEKAISEMKRVLRPGGKIASVTPMNVIPSTMSLGTWPEDCSWHSEFDALLNKIYQAYFKLDTFDAYVKGLKTTMIPRFFARQGLEEVSIFSLGKAFSLSNAAYSHEEKLRYLELYQLSEEKKLDAFLTLPKMLELITLEEAERFRILIREKCAWHRTHLDENSIWEWQGDANLLVTGIWRGR